jgi:hypothetical protein
LNLQDWRSRQNMWDQTRHALRFFQEHLPFTEMRHADSLTSAGDDYCFAKAGYVYAIYLPKGGSTDVDLPAASYSVQWYNPRTGGKLARGSVRTVKGPGKVSIGKTPGANNAKEDWVALLKLQGPPPKVIPKLPASTESSGTSASKDRPKKKPTARPKPALIGQGKITGFTLINADTNKPIKEFDPIKNGAIIDLAKLQTRNLNIRANVSGRVPAVQFSLDGKIIQTEKTTPFAMKGDTKGNYNAWTPKLGKHTLVGSVPGGEAKQNVKIRFEVPG